MAKRQLKFDKEGPDSDDLYLQELENQDPRQIKRQTASPNAKGADALPLSGKGAQEGAAEEEEKAVTNSI